MSDLERLSFSIDKSLAQRLEESRRGAGYANRSEFLRDLIRRRLVEEAWSDDASREVIGTITLAYDHHKRQLGETLTQLQHDHHDEVLVSSHVHLDRHHCAEVILTRGRPAVLRKLADALIRQKGVLHGEVTMTSTGAALT